jgi:hypothetical protein
MILEISEDDHVVNDVSIVFEITLGLQSEIERRPPPAGAIG